MADNLAHLYNRRQVLRIGDLPDDVLLETFNLYVVRYQDLDFRLLDKFGIKRKIELWQSLVHVCRRWRGLVFASPRRLNLQICCITRTSLKKATLDVWPALPLHILGTFPKISVDNVIAALEYSDRISTIDFEWLTNFHVERLWTAMQVPFPELTVLRLYSILTTLDAPIVPDSFLGGSSPRLREIWLNAVSFPGLPKLLLSATRLTEIHLGQITPSGYISPETMVTCLSALTNLKTLHLELLTEYRHDSESRHPPSPTRSMLPALTDIQFEGTSEYLEDLVSRIDAPQLNALFISFVNEVDLDVPQLAQFISRTPMFNILNEARVGFCEDSVRFRLSSPTFGFDWLKVLCLCGELDQPLSILARVWTSFSPLFSMLDNLFIYVVECGRPRWQDIYNIESLEWAELLLPFTAVKSLYISDEFVPGITAALQEPDVLPTLQNFFLGELQRSGPVQESIGQFIATRQLLGHPIAVSLWEEDLDIDSYSDWEIYDVNNQ